MIYFTTPYYHNLIFSSMTFSLYIKKTFFNIIIFTVFINTSFLKYLKTLAKISSFFNDHCNVNDNM